MKHFLIQALIILGVTLTPVASGSAIALDHQHQTGAAEGTCGEKSGSPRIPCDNPDCSPALDGCCFSSTITLILSPVSWQAPLRPGTVRWSRTGAAFESYLSTFIERPPIT